MGNDPLRYFLLREVVFGQDGSFSFDAVVQRYNSDLANDLGNLSSRTLTMINRYFGGSIPYPSPLVAKKGADDAIRDQAQATIAEFNQLFDEYQFNRALECAWTLVASVNKYLVEQEPWIVAEKEGDRKSTRLNSSHPSISYAVFCLKKKKKKKQKIRKKKKKTKKKKNKHPKVTHTNYHANDAKKELVTEI